MERDGRQRVYVMHVWPVIDEGRFPIKRIVGDRLIVEADLVADGHDVVQGRLAWRQSTETSWSYARLQALGNDRYHAVLELPDIGLYEYQIQGWVDEFLSWRHRLEKKVAAGQDVAMELVMGRKLVASRVSLYGAEHNLMTRSSDVHLLRDWLRHFDKAQSEGERLSLSQSSQLDQTMQKLPDLSHLGQSPQYSVRVDRLRAGFSAWYEFFPRSCPTRQNGHGTFKNCTAFLPYIANLGFDVVYLPPVHPIGTQHRKGPNNQTMASVTDPGSPWAIGNDEGGHTSVHPQLGTLDDFDRFHSQVRELGMELAMDLTFQCSPDHPWVDQHPEWFRHFPDGTIQYAENPPKKYEDVFPLNFDSEHWQSLWQALLDATIFWAERGVRIFRVDNPHTKPLVFWQWFIAEMQKRYPDVIFLSEAFTRPKLMEALSKIGFSQSYTYFTWRNTAPELREYLLELTQTEKKEFFRPNFWPNTPDILPQFLQSGLPSAFTIRFILAATLSSNYGIYGPAFELLEHHSLIAGGEEYDHSEKYEIRSWNVDHEPNIQEVIRKVNHIRRQEVGLQHRALLTFHQIDNPWILVYSKREPNYGPVLLIVVNLDPVFTQSGWTALDMNALGLGEDAHYVTHDLLTGARYTWHGSYNYVELHPDGYNAHILRIEEGI